MATTLEEISTSRRLNRRFWNAEVRFTICLIRERERLQDNEPGRAERLYRALRLKLRQRAMFQYFVPDDCLLKRVLFIHRGERIEGVVNGEAHREGSWSYWFITCDQGEQLGMSFAVPKNAIMGVFP